MMVDIDAEGKVSKAEVSKPVGQGFDEAAREAVLQYLFSPAEIDGKPAAIRIEYTLHFVPKTEAARVDGGAGAADAGLWTPRRRRPRRRPTYCSWSGACARRGRAIPSPARGHGHPPHARRQGARPGMVVGGTDAEGRFEVKGQPRTAHAPDGHEPRHEPCIRDLVAFELTGDKPFEIDCLVLEGAGCRPTRPPVRARKPPPAVTRYELAQPELRVVPGTFGDPLRVVQNLPGVARTPFGLGALVIRGASPNDSGIYVEGHKIPLLYHFLVGPGVLAPELIDRIDFFPGNFG
jgi:TonB family protein